MIFSQREIEIINMIFRLYGENSDKQHLKIKAKLRVLRSLKISFKLIKKRGYIMRDDWKCTDCKYSELIEHIGLFLCKNKNAKVEISPIGLKVNDGVDWPNEFCPRWIDKCDGFENV